MQCPDAASSPVPAAKVSQKAATNPSIRSRDTMTRPPVTMTARVRARPGDIGRHQRSCGFTSRVPRSPKTTTSPKLEGLKTWRPPTRTLGAGIRTWVSVVMRSVSARAERQRGAPGRRAGEPEAPLKAPDRGPEAPLKAPERWRGPESSDGGDGLQYVELRGPVRR